MSAMYEELQHFAGGFFHEDYQLEFSTADDAVRAFPVEQGAGAVAHLLADLDQLLASSVAESDLRQLWIIEYGARYDPTRDGRTYREWFTHVRDVLTHHPPT